MKIKQVLHITEPNDFLKGDYHSCFALFDKDVSFGDWIVVGEIELDVNVEPQALIDKTVAAIDAKAEKIRGEMSAKLAILEARKNELLAITHQPEEA